MLNDTTSVFCENICYLVKLQITGKIAQIRMSELPVVPEAMLVRAQADSNW